MTPSTLQAESRLPKLSWLNYTIIAQNVNALDGELEMAPKNRLLIFSLLIDKVRYHIFFSLFVAIFLFSPPAFAEDYQMVDFSIAQLRVVTIPDWFEAGSIVDFDPSLGVEIDPYTNDLKVWLIGQEGRRFRVVIQKESRPLKVLPWNSAEHNLVCDESSLGAQAGYLFLALLALPMSVLPFFAAKGKDNPKRYWWFIISFFLLTNEPSIVQVPSYLQARSMACREARTLIAGHVNHYKSKSFYNADQFMGLLPFHPSEAAKLRRVLEFKREDSITNLNLAWELLFLLVLGFQIPAAVTGVHYMFARHPAEKQIYRNIGGTIEISMPEFLEDKAKARRISNLAELLRAEREAAEEVVRHQRAVHSKERKS